MQTPMGGTLLKTRRDLLGFAISNARRSVRGSGEVFSVEKDATMVTDKVVAGFHQYYRSEKD